MGFTSQVPVTIPMHIPLHSVRQLLSLEHVSFVVIPVHEEKHPSRRGQPHSIFQIRVECSSVVFQIGVEYSPGIAINNSNKTIIGKINFLLILFHHNTIPSHIQILKSNHHSGNISIWIHKSSVINIVTISIIKGVYNIWLTKNFFYI